MSDKSKAIAANLAEWQAGADEPEQDPEDCRCCCCTGECSYTQTDLDEIEVKVYYEYGELDRYPF